MTESDPTSPGHYSVPFGHNSADLHIVVQALGDELSRHDQQLLQALRSVVTEHEIRRATILDELQGLARRIGTLPTRERIAH
jgi:hypothetical protein